jgi:hypothetical protein
VICGRVLLHLPEGGLGSGVGWWVNGVLIDIMAGKFRCVLKGGSDAEEARGTA